MRRTLFLVGALLCVSVSAWSQGPAGAGAGSGSSHHFSAPAEPSAWQLAVGYQFNRINLVGNPFNTNGLNVSAARYFGRWFGVEAQVGAGFGNTGSTTVVPNLTAKSLFAGGGPRLALRGHGRVEPWAHFVIGIEHFRFSQTSDVLGSNTALAGVGGGGLDFRVSPRISVRVEGDWLESHFFSMNQRSFQAVSSVVFDF